MDRNLLFYLAVCLTCFLSQTTAEDELADGQDKAAWGYKGSAGPANWGDSYPLCNGMKQSPIDIDPGTATYSSLLNKRPIDFQKYDLPLTGSDIHVINNGHTLTVRMSNYQAHAITIFGGSLPYEYELAQFHWHWGGENTKGSEHTFQGKAYPMEMHFVHLNKLYGNDVEAIETNQDGIAVVGVFVEVGEYNAAFDDIIDSFAATNHPESNATSVPISLATLRPFLPNDTNRFYRYDGSLTTPPCFEAVIWTVMRDSITISQAQLDRFRTELKKDKSINRTPSASNTMKDNFRDVQPLHGRKVMVSYSSETDGILDTDYLDDHHWGYYVNHGKTLAPHQWGLNYQQCSGNRQSPIHIRHSEATPSPELSASPWVLKNYDTIPNSVMSVMENNGHTVVIQMGEGIHLSGGGLPAEYRLLQFHWHWGRHNANGSEHMLDGNQYPAEIHLVHTNTYYGDGKDFDQISKNPDGLAVLGTFIEVGDHNPAFDPIIAEMEKIKYASPNNKVDINLKSVRGLLPADMSEFYRYEGSLTTPPCWEVVVWTVFKNTIKISQGQLDYFRTKVLNLPDPEETTVDGHSAATPAPAGGNGNTDHSTGGDHHDTKATEYAILDNFRPVQNVNFRVVKYAKIRGGSVSSAGVPTVCWTLLLAALLRFVSF